MHPFLTFEISISEGGYIRSMGEIIASKFGFDGALSSLERLSEGNFVYENERGLNPLDFIALQENYYLGDRSDIELGRKLSVNDFEHKSDGIYKLVHLDELSVLEIKEEEVKYLLNKVKLC